MSKITIGCDPEYIIEGWDGSTLPPNEFEFIDGMDGNAAELRPLPADNVDDLIRHLAEDICLDAKNIHDLNMITQHEEYATGGHIHIAGGTTISSELFGLLMDIIVAFRSRGMVDEESFIHRLSSYGRLSDMRSGKHHGGFEYRTLGSWWLNNPIIARSILGMSLYIATLCDEHCIAIYNLIADYLTDEHEYCSDQYYDTNVDIHLLYDTSVKVLNDLQNTFPETALKFKEYIDLFNLLFKDETSFGLEIDADSWEEELSSLSFGMISVDDDFIEYNEHGYNLVRLLYSSLCKYYHYDRTKMQVRIGVDDKDFVSVREENGVKIVNIFFDREDLHGSHNRKKFRNVRDFTERLIPNSPLTGEFNIRYLKESMDDFRICASQSYVTTIMHILRMSTKDIYIYPFNVEDDDNIYYYSERCSLPSSKYGIQIDKESMIADRRVHNDNYLYIGFPIHSFDYSIFKRLLYLLHDLGYVEFDADGFIDYETSSKIGKIITDRFGIHIRDFDVIAFTPKSTVNVFMNNDDFLVKMGAYDVIFMKIFPIELRKVLEVVYSKLDAGGFIGTDYASYLGVVTGKSRKELAVDSALVEIIECLKDYGYEKGSLKWKY